MTSSKGYAALSAGSPLAPFAFERRDPGPRDVVLAIDYCGMCHSDLHQLRNEWGRSRYPLVPGHEIVGRVTAIGRDVVKFKVGDPAGVGVIIDSCRSCSSCREGEEQYCLEGPTGTYNDLERDGKTPTFGGYSDGYVCDEAFVHHVPGHLDQAAVAPLLCAGITTYSPLRHWGAGRGKKVGIVGLGGLGHMGLKFAHSFGAETVQFTTSEKKREDARALGAREVVLSTDPAEMKKHARSFDLILDTVAAPHSLDDYTALLGKDGTLVLVGMPEQPPTLNVLGLPFRRASVAGSIIGGMAETQEMLDYCGANNIVAEVEVVAIDQAEACFERMLRGDVKYRFVIDMKTLA